MQTTLHGPVPRWVLAHRDEKDNVFVLMSGVMLKILVFL